MKQFQSIFTLRVPLLSFCFLSLISTTVLAQSPDYKSMMDDHSYNFYEVVEAADSYFATHGTGKGSGWKIYQRWKNENESKYGPTGDRAHAEHFLIHEAYNEIARSSNAKSKTSFDSGWVELGPWNTDNVTSHYSPGIGRVETFWVNPNDDQHILLGSRSGGFWRTYDGGNNWENTTDFLVASGVPAIAVNPYNIEEILISVQHGGAEYTHGIYRSLDGGSTWAITNFNPQKLHWGGLGDNKRIYKIAYHPTEKDQVFVCSNKGLYVSINNLGSWSNPFTGICTDVAFHPTNSSIIYSYNFSGTDKNYLKKSTNRGLSFKNAGEFPGNLSSRIFLSTTPAVPNHVYAASTNNVYRSSNSGTWFFALSNPDENGLAFAVSDLDINNMIYGYVDLHSSTDNGKNFTKRTQWSVQDAAYIHADLRIAKCVNGVFYVGTDGYLAKSEDNGVTWTILNNGTAIREFYAVGLSQGDYDVQMAGSQDNGTSILNKDGWVEWNGGDGMEALVHQLNSDWMIGSWQYGSRNYTRDGGLTRQSTGNPDRGSGSADWEAPFLQNPLNDMQVLHFSDDIYKGDKFGLNWHNIGSPGIGIVRDAAIAENDSNIIAACRLADLKLTKDGGKSWSSITTGLPGYYITDIAFDPNDNKTIAVTYNRYQKDDRKIFITHDQGNTWSNITYNLGDMPLRTVVIDHSDSSYIYVGGEIGIYYKSKNASTWTLYNNNLPNVTVKDLEIHYGSNTLRAATWGRGLWEYTLVGRNEHPSITHTKLTTTPTDFGPKATVNQYVYATIEYDGTLANVYVNWSTNDQSLSQNIPMQQQEGNLWKSSMPIANSTLGDRIYFKVFAESTTGRISETGLFNYGIKEYKYCDAIGSTNTGSDYITHVKINDYTNTSEQDYYGDFTNSDIQLYNNTDYTLEVGLAFHWDSDSITAWVDYNRDSDFSENEQIIMSRVDESHKATGTLTAPANVLLGEKLRMRIRNQYYGYTMSPCGTNFGEVEDYSITFSKKPNSIVPITHLATEIKPNPSNGNFSLHFSKNLKEGSVSITDITGKVVHTHNFINTQVSYVICTPNWQKVLTPYL